MSFVITHGLQGYLFRFIPVNSKLQRIRNWITLIIVISAMLPDIIPISETIRGNYSHLYAWSHGAELKTNINNEWSIHLPWAETPTERIYTIRWWMIPTIGWALHVFIDSFTHNENGWTTFGWVFEGICVAFFVWLLIQYWNIFRSDILTLYHKIF